MKLNGFGERRVTCTGTAASTDGVGNSAGRTHVLSRLRRAGRRRRASDDGRRGRRDEPAFAEGRSGRPALSDWRLRGARRTRYDGCLCVATLADVAPHLDSSSLCRAVPTTVCCSGTVAVAAAPRDRVRNQDRLHSIESVDFDRGCRWSGTFSRSSTWQRVTGRPRVGGWLLGWRRSWTER